MKHISIAIIGISLFILIPDRFKSQDYNRSSIDKKFSINRPSMNGDPGFFLDDWKEKKNPKIKLSKELLIVNQQSTTYSYIDFSKPLTKISKYIFGNNLGHWTNRKFLQEDQFIFNLKDIGIQVVRFPGGNASNDYFWDAGNIND